MPLSDISPWVTLSFRPRGHAIPVRAMMTDGAADKEWEHHGAVTGVNDDCQGNIVGTYAGRVASSTLPNITTASGVRSVLEVLCYNLR